MVPFPAPTQAAVFAPQLQNLTAHQALTTIAGSCENLTPAGAVSIWRGGVAIGSTPCYGSFTLQIMLQPGANQLVARTVNATGQYGPDSVPVTITLVLPSPLPPPTNPTIEPSSPASEIVSTDVGAAHDLTAVTVTPTSELTNSLTITLQVVVAGGDRPYDIMLNWGDGSVDSRSVDQPGTYDFTHTYQNGGIYAVHGRVRDVLGAYTEFDHAVVSRQVASPAPLHRSTHLTTPASLNIWQQPTFQKLVLASATAAVLLAISYWLGWHRASQALAKRVARTVRRRPVGNNRPRRVPKRGRR